MDNFDLRNYLIEQKKRELTEDQEELLNEIMTNPNLSDYVILFRAHPEMMWRVDERSIIDEGLKHVYLDCQTASFYKSRFNTDDKSAGILIWLPGSKYKESPGKAFADAITHQ